MVGQLKYLPQDPNRMQGMNRGAGWYWHRGKGIFSKYEGKHDAQVQAKVPSWVKKLSPETKEEMQMKDAHMFDLNKNARQRTTKRTYGGHPVPSRKGYF